ncbi:cation:proton antiporter [Streptomyces sp. NPDC050704]|uniref:cation:proton antiporter n=1 Tax=Streptomyces sp. NPDC050704 TaxID=3157219 RepID=UPI003426E54D
MSERVDVEWIAAVALGDLALILLFGVVCVALARRLRQPAVIGEMTAGILLGPSLLGLLPGNLTERLFPQEVRPFLSVIAQVGLVLFMFIVGWEYDSSPIRNRRRAIGTIWICSVAVPIGAGMALAAALYSSHDVVDGQHIRMLDFALYLGVVMSVTAFPVLARIIAEHRQSLGGTGALALTLAAADDVLAWCMLAVVAARVTSDGAGDFLVTAGWLTLFTVLMFVAVRPLLAAVFRRFRTSSHGLLSAVIAAGACLSAYATSEIGLHAVFGAFLFGVVMPRGSDSGLLQTVVMPLEQVAALLLPVFFVVAGLSVDLTSLSGAGVLEMLAIIAVACISKLGGVAVPARLSGSSWREASALGLLMNTRGVTQLVVLGVGLDLGLLGIPLFTSMVVMALVTTAMTAPLLAWILPRPPDAADTGPGLPQERERQRTVTSPDRTDAP